MLLVGVLAAVVVSVGAHDTYCHYVHFDSAPLCQRADGSLWRDPSNGCFGHEDPACQYEECPDSEMLSEDWRHTCSWVILRREVAPSGPAPYYDGPAPRSGVPGRLQ